MARARILMKHPDLPENPPVETNIDAYREKWASKGWIAIDGDGQPVTIPDVVVPTQVENPEGSAGQADSDTDTSGAGVEPESGAGSGSDSDPVETGRSRRGS